MFLLRDASGYGTKYTAISTIEFQGSINSAGQSQGHYVCDVKEPTSKLWFRTNDNSYPLEILEEQVTKQAYVVLLKRENE